MRISAILKGFAAVGMLLTAVGATAGNIPQYSFTETRTGFEYLEDATSVKATYGEADEMIFPGKQTLLAYTGEGFPIGFDFKYAGKVFNQFAINNNGYILLGYDKVEFKGYCNLFFNEASLYASNSFYMGIAPSIFGIKEGEISYKLEGSAGNHTLTVEFAHLGVREPNARGNAIYSLQIVLSEKDSQVRFNFLEEESPYTTIGLVCGICGWSKSDSMIITSPGLGDPAKVSSLTTTSMQTREGLLLWDADDILGLTHDDPYSFNFTFTPTGSPDFVCEAPTDLSVDQVGSSAIISCKRSSNAPATVIMVSENPILKFPEQGVSYPVANDKGEYLTKFGDATMVYYSNGENPSAEFPNLKTSTKYYVKAFGVNGYPSYSTETAAALEFMSSHPAPYIIQASSLNKGISVRTVGDYDVVIAATVDRVNSVSEGRTGIFGTPADNCQVGDMIEGGGEIIYIGAPGTFTYNEALPNRQTFFRAWSLHEGRISKTSINASGVTNPEMPFEPKLELYTLYEPPLGWVAQTGNTDGTVTTNFVPRTRGENDEPVIGGISLSYLTSLISPTLNFGSNAVLNFEWAMETEREPEAVEGGMVVLPSGNKPGEFGNGHKFRVFVTYRGGEKDLFTTSVYSGSMTPTPADKDHFISGTSEFFPVSIPLEGLTNGKINFAFSTQGTSILYLRNISVTNSSGVETPVTAEGLDRISTAEGSMIIFSAGGGSYEIYTLDGIRAAKIMVGEGEEAVVALEKGVYLLNGSKYIVR